MEIFLLRETSNLTKEVDSESKRFREVVEVFARLLAPVIEANNEEVAGHTTRVVKYSIKLAEFLGLEENQIYLLKIGALLHDIGKMGIPSEILKAKRKLTEEELEILKTHPSLPAIWFVDFHNFHRFLTIAYEHHERWDGVMEDQFAVGSGRRVLGGYPNGLRGVQIDIKSRLFALVDVWDAMRSDRAYKRSIPRNESLMEILNECGTHFDPYLTVLFVIMILEDNLKSEEYPQSLGFVVTVTVLNKLKKLIKTLDFEECDLKLHTDIRRIREIVDRYR
jgi:response regulator RpfG family c-di-GMP phosphodiesterase